MKMFPASPAWWFGILYISVSLVTNDLTPPASLIIRPNTSQFFEYESVSLSCEVQGSSAEWRLRRYTENSGLADCGSGWGTLQGSSCNKVLAQSDSGRYWCESWSGEYSNAANITVHGGLVILVSPTLPVTEGHSVTLSCRYKSTPSDLTADFYKDGSLISTEPTGEMTIHRANKSNKGLYKCSMSKEISPESLMTVAASPPPSSSSPPSCSTPPSSSCVLSLSVIGSASGLCLIILLVLFYYMRNKRNNRNNDLAAESRDVMYADVRIMNRQTGADPVSFEVRTANYTGADPVYSEVKIPQVPERGRDLERKILKGLPS